MEQQTSRVAPAELSAKENVLLGIVGALLFSLAGAVVFFLFYLVDFIAWLSGFVAIAAAFFGYGLFSGNKHSRKGLIIAAVAAILSMLLANYVSYAYDFLKELQEIGATQGFGFALSKTFSLICGNTVEIAQGRDIWVFTPDNASLLKNLLLSLLFTVIGCVLFFRTMLAATKKRDESSLL